MIKVLIVEDDPMVAELNRRFLDKVEGFAFYAAVRSTAEALAILEKADIDLVLLDVYMPGMDGLQLLSQIRESGKGTDVILVTAACDKASIEKALRYGVVDYLIKPFEFERFSTALLAYREKTGIMKGSDTFDQKQLDRLLLNKEQPAYSPEIPKGLDRNTLRLVWSCIVQIGTEEFSTEELSSRVGISRVSIRKYLDFLNSVGVLQQDINYGSVGRPVYKYRRTDLAENIIKKYLL